jgi:hypothetical protein
MATKPAERPNFATGGSALIETPTVGKQEIGWVGEKPPLQWFNWLHKWTYEWLRYLELVTDFAPTRLSLSPGMYPGDGYLLTSTTYAKVCHGPDWSYGVDRDALTIEKFNPKTGEVELSVALPAGPSAAGTPILLEWTPLGLALMWQAIGTLWKLDLDTLVELDSVTGLPAMAADRHAAYGYFADEAAPHLVAIAHSDDTLRFVDFEAMVSLANIVVGGGASFKNVCSLKCASSAGAQFAFLDVTNNYVIGANAGGSAGTAWTFGGAAVRGLVSDGEYVYCLKTDGSLIYKMPLATFAAGGVATSQAWTAASASDYSLEAFGGIVASMDLSKVVIGKPTSGLSPVRTFAKVGAGVPKLTFDGERIWLSDGLDKTSKSYMFSRF